MVTLILYICIEWRLLEQNILESVDTSRSEHIGLLGWTLTSNVDKSIIEGGKEQHMLAGSEELISKYTNV